MAGSSHYALKDSTVIYTERERLRQREMKKCVSNRTRQPAPCHPVTTQTPRPQNTEKVWLLRVGPRAPETGEVSTFLGSTTIRQEPARNVARKSESECNKTLYNEKI